MRRRTSRGPNNHRPPARTPAERWLRDMFDCMAMRRFVETELRKEDPDYDLINQITQEIAAIEGQYRNEMG